MMVAFNFQKQFAEAVARGDKRQTVRAARRDGRVPCRVGGQLQLYTGMRTGACRKLADAVCTEVAAVRIATETGVTRLYVDGRPLSRRERLAFAAADGFADTPPGQAWFAFKRFFESTHGLPFDGWLIRWTPEAGGGARV